MYRQRVGETFRTPDGRRPGLAVSRRPAVDSTSGRTASATLYSLSLADILFVTALTFVGSALQGAIGFGMGLLAAPLLILLDPRFVPAPILVCTMVLTLLMTYRERHAIDVRGIKWAMLGRVAGTVVAGAILAVAAADTLVLLFGIFILAAVAMSVSGLRFQPSGRALVTAGVVSGVLGTVAAVGGPRWRCSTRTPRAPASGARSPGSS